MESDGKDGKVSLGKTVFLTKFAPGLLAPEHALKMCLSDIALE